MIRFLLDINVLMALIDPTHVQHDRSHKWFAAKGQRAWATCPIPENGLLRIRSSSIPEHSRTSICCCRVVGVIAEAARACVLAR